MTARPWYTVGTTPLPAIAEAVTLDFTAILAEPWPARDELVERAPGDAVYCATDDPRVRGWLSCQHAASSYGQPVFILHDGTALGTAEVGVLYPHLTNPIVASVYAYGHESAAQNATRIAHHPTIIAAVAAGYAIHVRGQETT